MDYSYIIIPLITVISSQVIKLLTDGIKGNFDFKNIFISYGGMPSGHTAFSVSITTLIGLDYGFDAPIFAIAFVFTILVMRDALSFRNLLGNQAKLFNRLRQRLPAAESADIPKFREQFGHSWVEVLAGVIWGAGLTYFLNLL